MSTIPKYILNRNGGGGGGGSLNPEDLKTVGYDSLVKDPMMPVGNVDFGYQQDAPGYPGGYLHVGGQRAPMRTINGERLIGTSDIVITPGDANMVPITYAALKALRDGEKLVPGTWYRIIDYECTTVAPDTESARHQFDIVVLATGIHWLDNNAFAVQHDAAPGETDDHYFDTCRLEDWRLLYTIDDLSNRFGWHDAVSGKGVIYWMRDEWGNEAPYDFKNIRFARWAVGDITGKLTPEALQSLKDIFVYNDKDNPFFFGLQDTGYHQGGLNFEIVDKIHPAYYYTFGGDTDQSLNGGANGCYGNVIKPWIDNLGVQQLNNGVWVKAYGGKGRYHHSTTCGYNCHDWTCGNDCSGWTCGNGCNGWTCGNSCFGWTCGNSCYGWTCGNECYHWTCGNDCYGWTCGNYCRYFHILSSTNGDLNGIIAPNINYSQYVGFDSQGTLKSLNIFD